MNVKAVYNGNHPQDIARREGFRSGALTSAWVCTAIAVVIMTGLHTALMMRSDQTHESALVSIRKADALLLKECRDTVYTVAGEDYEKVREYMKKTAKQRGE